MFCNRVGLLVFVLAAGLAMASGCSEDDPVSGGSADAALPTAPDARSTAPDARSTAPDAAVTGSVDATVPSGADAAPGEVLCGSEVCGSDQECCVNQGGSGVSFACATAGTCAGAAVGCDSPDDCSAAGELCCASLSADGAKTSCETAAQCSFALCNIPAECPNTGDMCCSNPALPGYAVCSSFCL